MGNPCMMLNQLLGSLYTRKIPVGLWLLERGWEVWIVHPVDGRKIYRYFDIHDFGAITPWLEAQVQQHYGVDVRDGMI